MVDNRKKNAELTMTTTLLLYSLYLKLIINIKLYGSLHHLTMDICDIFFVHSCTYHSQTLLKFHFVILYKQSEPIQSYLPASHSASSSVCDNVAIGSKYHDFSPFQIKTRSFSTASKVDQIVSVFKSSNVSSLDVKII